MSPYCSIMISIISATFRIFFPLLPSACGWPFLLAFVSFLLWIWFTSTICCFASVYIWKESFCTSKYCTQILALKAGKGGSGNLLVRVKRSNVGNWKHADKHLTVSRSVLGKHKVPVYYWLLSQSAAYHSPTALLSAQPILWLKDDAPAAPDIHVNKENKYFVGKCCRK